MRARQLDAAAVAEGLYEVTRRRYTVLGHFAEGQVGAARVRAPEGHTAVLKWRPDTRVEDFRAGPLTVAETMRQAGCPAPATELSAQVGAHATPTPADVVARLDALLDAAPAGRLWPVWAHMSLRMGTGRYGTSPPARSSTGSTSPAAASRPGRPPRDGREDAASAHGPAVGECPPLSGGVP